MTLRMPSSYRRKRAQAPWTSIEESLLPTGSYGWQQVLWQRVRYVLSIFSIILHLAGVKPFFALDGSRLDIT